MKKITFALLIFCAFACNERVCVELDTAIQTELKDGDLVCIGGEEYDFFASDNRCECGATCVWEGQFNLSFQDSEGVNIYSYASVDTMSNTTPPFAESFRMVSFSGGNPNCGEPNNVDEITFVVQID